MRQQAGNGPKKAVSDTGASAAYDGGMSKRLWRYLMVVGGAALAGALAESPAWAHSLVEARRSAGFGIFRGLGLLCCIVIVVLVGIGVLIGMMVGRRRGRGPGDY
jgi:hypothetical protein